ncbi:hypothetical protein BBJ28_00014845 [Nothophytophthora sp. Chile5]|nr:hypothetical protein BBJ28_00014845 [Nothophytophthora sp. Chile5]
MHSAANHKAAPKHEKPLVTSADVAKKVQGVKKFDATTEKDEAKEEEVELKDEADSEHEHEHEPEVEEAEEAEEVAEDADATDEELPVEKDEL